MRRTNGFVGIAICLLSLMAFALFFNREGIGVPGWNEHIYLLYLIKAFHPEFLAGDWTMREITAGHAVFNYAFGWPAVFVSIETVAWVGRIGCWLLVFTAMIRLGQQFRIPVWLATAAIFFWLAERQSFVAYEWVIGSFEAKCVAYACLLWALDFMLRGRTILPGILLGTAFTFHGPVGLWGGGALALAFFTMRPWRESVQLCVWGFVFSVPGLVTTVWLMFGGDSISAEEAKFIVLHEMPFHLDPYVFGWMKIALLFVMLAFNVLQARNEPDDAKLRLMSRFQLFCGGFFLLGVAARAAGIYAFVQTFPFRVFAVLVMLFFFWHVAAAFWHARKQRPSLLMVLIGLAVFAVLPGPVTNVLRIADEQWPKWRQNHDDDYLKAATWIRQNAPANAVIIAPPWRKENFYYMQRPQIVNWHAPRFDAMTEWRARMEALVGDVTDIDVKDNLSGALDAKARTHYEKLTRAQVDEIAERYGGTLLLTTEQHAYPALFTSGEFTIYAVGR